MLIMKSAYWLRVAKPILLVCISLAEVATTPPPPVILWQVSSQLFSFFQVDFKSPVSNIFHQSVTFLYVTDSGEYTSHWVSRQRLASHTWHITGHFRDGSSQAIDCTDTENQTATKRKYIKRKITNPNTSKPTLAKTQKYI